MSIVVSASSSTGALADLRTCIQVKGYGTDTAPLVQNAAINSVYRRIIGMRRWPFLEQADNSDLNCVIGQSNYSLGAIEDLLHIDAVRLEFGSALYDLTFVDMQKLRSMEHVDVATSVPIYWSHNETQIRLYPRPNLEYNIRIDYISDPADLVGDTDTPVIPPAYRDVLCWGAIAEICFRERDMEGYNIAKQEYLNIVDNMMAEYGVRQRQSSDQVGVSGTYEILSQ